MTKLEAIEMLSELRGGYNFFDDSEQPYYEALSMAIEALSAQPQQWIPDAELEQVCRDLHVEYHVAIKQPWVNNPLAFALYQVWKKYDGEDGKNDR